MYSGGCGASYPAEGRGDVVHPLPCWSPSVVTFAQVIDGVSVDGLFLVFKVLFAYTRSFLEEWDAG